MSRRAVVNWVRGLGLAAVALVGLAVGAAAPSGADAVAGSAGTDTALPATDSAVTARGRGAFADLEVSVNQTADLGNQAISVTWTGGTPTVRAAGAEFAEHFVQIMQCWTEPGASEPVPEQCVFGATDGVFGGRNGALFASGGFADDRVISRQGFTSFDTSAGVFDDETNWLWMPFRSVTGDTVGAHIDTTFSPAVESGNYWLNPLFNVITTNEIAGGRTRADGTGEELFEVTTGLESSGLGCGQAVLDPASGGERQVPRCWLVIVPRGSASEENRDTIDDRNWGQNPAVMTSPLAPAAWANRIAVPLDFNPVDTPCDLNDDQRRIVGSELLLRAVGSWQPVLCGTPGLPPYAYANVGDASARLQLVSGAIGAPGLAVTSRPLSAGASSEANPVVYAPLTLSSVVIGFNVERVPDVESAGPEAEALRGIRVAELNLTPRLVAKLLTQSYQSQVRIASEPLPESHEWAEDNPRQLDQDPDFLRFNPEFELLRPPNDKNFGGLVLAAGTSDAARQVWEWILADPEARRWLDGEPDEFGMVVNPVYATTADANTSGVAFGDPVPESLPKSDPYCYEAPPQGPGGRVVPPALCGTDWFPYALSYRDAAQRARSANDGARTDRDPEAFSAERVWRADGPQRAGTRSILSLVDSPTAAQYGLQTARLSRSGDDGDDRSFIAPDADAMLAAVEVMEPAGESGVLVPDPLVEADGAYPLTALTYAAAMPLALDELAREEYSAFVEYAVGEGQVPGLEVGQLPPGYAELPDDLKARAREAATAIRETAALQEPTPTTTSPPTVPVPAAAVAPTAPTSSSSPPRPRAASAGPSTPPTTVPVTVAEPGSTTTTALELTSPGATPISSAGGARFVVPVLAALALLSMLGALEITKRPRRARSTSLPGSASVGVALTLAGCLAAGGVLANTRPAAAQEPEVGTLQVVGTDGAPIDGGGSATQFGLEPSGAVECPGDSANDDYRVYSFMVPIGIAAEDVAIQGNGPVDRGISSHSDFRMPLFDISTTEYSAALTAEREAPGAPGVIVNIPFFSLGVYAAGELPSGEYRIGLACTRLNEVRRVWDAEIEVVAAADDPAGFAWRVLGHSALDDSGGGVSPGAAVPIGGAVAAAAFLLTRTLRVRSQDRPRLENR